MIALGGLSGWPGNIFIPFFTVIHGGQYEESGSFDIEFLVLGLSRKLCLLFPLNLQVIIFSINHPFSFCISVRAEASVFVDDL